VLEEEEVKVYRECGENRGKQSDGMQGKKERER